MFGIGLPELIVIFLVILLLFGPKALPEIAKGLGKAVQSFKREVNDVKKDFNDTSQNNTESNPEEQILVDNKWDESNDFDPNTKKHDWRKEVKKEKS